MKHIIKKLIKERWVQLRHNILKKIIQKEKEYFLQGFLKVNLKQELMEALQMGKHMHTN